MAVIQKLGAFLEKFDEFLIAGLLIPLGKKIFDRMAEKGVEKVEKRIEKILGLNIEEARRDITDEILYSNVVYRMTDIEAQEIDAFEERLRRENAQQAEAFVLYIAKIVKQFERNIKEAAAPKKGEPGPRIEQEYKNLQYGIESAINVLRALLAKTGRNEEEKFKAKVAFLQGKNVFSLIPPEKKPDPIAEVGKKAFKKIHELGKELAGSQEASLADLAKTTENWATKTKTWRDSAPKRR